MKNIKLLIVVITFFLVPGCSDKDSNSESKDHVWKEQTDTIDKAREVEGLLQNSAENTRNMIEQQE